MNTEIEMAKTWPDCKFGILAVAGRVHLPPELTLSNGIRIFSKMPFTMEDHWKIWLGTLRFNEVQDCSLFLVRTEMSSSSEGIWIFDDVNERLLREVGGLFTMVRLVGPIEYSKAFLLSGHIEHGEPTVRRFTEAQKYHNTRGCKPWSITEPALTMAVQLYEAKERLFPPPNDMQRSRFGRGLYAMKKAFEAFYASDRLQGFVRAMEALILPEIGKTEKQFVGRCSLLAAPKPKQSIAEATLREVYRMRSDIEHMHELDRTVKTLYPADELEDVGLWRTRQMEDLACAAYRKIFLDPALQACFSDDFAIEAFWKKSPAEIRAAFGPICDITELKIVRKYDGFGRAVPPY